MEEVKNAKLRSTVQLLNCSEKDFRMPAFEIIDKKAQKVRQREFKSEQELHQLIDDNLSEIFKIHYIKDEHITTKHGRIETIGLDIDNFLSLLAVLERANPFSRY